ncbi:efflux transporter outer membrane subunit [Piscinibacter sp.]|uniref:efflux transporter outer membrane subunit n=1 Tax=Piscinibacter sp. TaxID=1903157 RepID=UPI0039E643C5
MPATRTTPRWSAPATALAAALTLAGCASLRVQPTDAAAGVALPAAWNAAAPQPEAAPATPLAAWWQRFGDPALSRLVEQALAANTSVASAQAALRQARALAQVQQARLGPSVGSSASVQRSQSDGGGGSNLFRAGFDASWEPDIFGGQHAARDASELDTQASAASLGDVQVSVAAEVAQGYIALRSAERRLAIARENLASQQETLQITQWRVQAGLATSLEAEQARTAVEQTRAQVPALQTTIAQSRHALALLTGRTAAGLSLPEGGALPQPAEDLALAFPADTLRQRPDVRAAEARVGAAAQRLVQAEAARYPSFNLSGTLGLSALTLSGLGAGGAAAASLLGGVSLPLFDGGALRAQASAQQAALDQARAAHRGAVLAALKDVEDALVALQGDRERLARLRDAAEAADNAALLARQRYASGLVDFQTVLTTQRTQLSAQDSVAAGNADVASDHVRLFKALGGGWTPLPSASSASDDKTS